ncbi:hypothetical protein ASD90_03805 [Terrabacter sp. Root181]|nr:DUF664 domain-containing protein [Terrabacter sp. Root181]KRB47483.1 hypothetical protein ASD90_03805 [Terrabacter sp. Root181]
MEARRAVRVRRPPPPHADGHEPARHAGHADILREQIDGSAGRFRDRDNLPEVDGDRWVAYLGRVQAAADAYR